MAILSCLAGDASAGPQILPSGSTVPENLLRIELELDRPVASPLDMQHVELLDAAGRPIPQPFLDLALISRDGQRITIMMHPGRVKTGVGPNVALGLAMRQGERVTLVISDRLLDVRLIKSWDVGPALRGRLVPEAWKIGVPRVGSRETLHVTLPSSIGAAATGLIALADVRGERVAGHADLTDHEMQWRFVPASVWRAGRYELRVSPLLEDVAGNRICSAFEEKNEHEADCRNDAHVVFHIGHRFD